jgi:predicted  nucleic acid-binding Zn-ribbon protein|tara:strand:- start:241 stop:399 length:159 start_codon:yes stop_codon:yes gene_type:complete
MKVEETNNINSKVLELQQKLRNLELAIDLYEEDLYKIDKRLEKIESEGNNDV